MKTNHKIWLSLLAGASLMGCADQTIDNFYVEKPASIAQYEYLNAYGNLKDYLSQRAGINPDFKLGVGVSASDYNKFGQVYRITNANFHQITAGNAMKYASIVGDDGSMDFSTVTAFVDAASKAGVEVYGHTLCWHEQQNVKWLNSLIADKELDIDPNEKLEVEDAIHEFKNDAKFPFYVMGYEPQIVDGILTVPEYPGEWYQFFVMDGLSTVPGRTYKVTAKVKGSKAGSMNVQLGNWGATLEKQMEFSDDWAECSVTIDGVTTESSFVVFQPGTYDGKLEIEWVKLSHHESPAVEVESEITFKTYTDGPFPFFAMGCEPPVINGCIHFVPTGDWSQFFILPGGENPLTEGDYVLYLDITASKNAEGVELTMQNGWGDDAQKLSVPVPISAGDNVVRLKFSGVTGGNYDVILKPQTTDATLDVRSVKVCKVEKLNKIPVTPEEKAEILTAEMERWIKGMMEATAGQVKAWDVVNEAISGGPWGQRYDLQHAATGSGDQSNKFYWQDYLGDNFVRIPVKFARKYFAENGGNPEELKLFINDYNLESDWDDNQKLKSLIQWIEQWESDGETKIDGIGSQMHIKCYMNPETQASNEQHVVKMLELMAATGKLVRITELDMGLCDENGNTVKTEDVTFEQHQAMAKFYKFVIDKYFEIVPLSQQYGICQWAQTDSPEGSGWRPGEPIGLWDLNYSRKPAYGGFADGLAGKSQD
ncbi:endo-1,4-beta-xylanase [uncultured Duncaniella sp.]|jgi:GH35 family endo-1,4-beta-xylanase|uniref:endo-1,4-beta-xylanase n=3 Tax=uncultured Duncaniella sp. TaxID=2768039 RepID=UPI0025AF7597|nr:endo-1,4-beta-xylanase [uncultured Duncaniella sp.]